MGSASGSEIVGREPMFTATDSASVGIRVSPAAEVPFCPTLLGEVSVVTVRSRFLEMFRGDFGLPGLGLRLSWATCRRLLLGVWLVGFEGALAGGQASGLRVPLLPISHLPL